MRAEKGGTSISYHRALRYGFKPDTLNKMVADGGDPSGFGAGMLSAEESAAAAQEREKRSAAAAQEREKRSAAAEVTAEERERRLAERKETKQAAKDERGAAKDEKAAAASEKRASKKEQQEAGGSCLELSPHQFQPLNLRAPP